LGIRSHAAKTAQLRQIRKEAAASMFLGCYGNLIFFFFVQIQQIPFIIT
jgi:hypothetical protein